MGRNKKDGLTVEQHRAIGRRLREIIREFNTYYHMINTNFGKSKKVSRYASNVNTNLTYLRHELFDDLSRKIPLPSTEPQEIYLDGWERRMNEQRSKSQK